MHSPTAQRMATGVANAGAEVCIHVMAQAVTTHQLTAPTDATSTTTSAMNVAVTQLTQNVLRLATPD